MSRAIPTGEFGRGYRAHKPTEAHRAHVERVEKTAKRSEAIRYGKNVKNGESSPNFSDEEDRHVERNDMQDAGSQAIDPLAEELDRDEAIRQDLIAKVRRHGDREGLDTMDTDELEVLWKEIDAKRKAASKKMFDYSAKIQENGPAKPAIAPSKPRTVPSTNPTRSRKRERSPSDAGGSRKHAPTQSNNGRNPYYPSPAHSSPRRRAQASSRSTRRESAVPATRCSASTHDKQHSNRSASHSRSYSRRRSPSRSRSRSYSREQLPRQDSDAESDAPMRSDDTDKNEQNHTRAKNQKKSAETGKLRNYAGLELELINKAFDILLNHLYTKHPFPSEQVYVQLIHQSWREAVNELKINPDKFPIDKGHKKTLRNRVNSSHGHLRDHVRDEMERQFPFHDGKMTEEEIAAEVERLLPHGIHQKPRSGPLVGWFGHPWIQRVILKAFFVGRSPIATSFNDDWNPIPMKVVAVVCAIMAFLVGQWTTGKLPVDPDHAPKGRGVPRGPRMTYTDVQEDYATQYKFLKDMGKTEQAERRDMLLYQMYTDCMKSAAVKRAIPLTVVKERAKQYENSEMFAEDALSKEEQAQLARMKAARHGSATGASVEEPATDAEDEPANVSDDENVGQTGGDPSLEIGWDNLNDEDILASSDRHRSATPVLMVSRRAKPVLHPLASSISKPRAPSASSPWGLSDPSRMQSPTPTVPAAANPRPSTNNLRRNWEGSEASSSLGVKRRLEVVLPTPLSSSQRLDVTNSGLKISNAKGPRAAGLSGRLKVRKSVPSASQP
ncbi:hypothetical protein RhiLY_07964 [Ceratobasidium sp. AG-Ba]|nr:hypothetical protein RhiLY_07964 [Ceratobasidium sp. AG-Ba]